MEKRDMPHQNTQSPRATAQNSVTGSTPAADVPTDREKQEPRSYAAGNVADSTLAAPAAGEMATFGDDIDDIDASGMQNGANHTRRPIATEAKRGQGPKTLRANRKMVKSGSPDQGTH
jgi:hypothetical protein